MVSVESFVQYVVKSSKITASLTDYLLQTEGKDLAIVFDGYDEVSEEDRKNSIIADIIYRRIFAKCCLVITSRPTASSSLHGTVDCRVEIVGFTEEDRLDYIQTALQGNNDKVKTLTLYLQSNPTINALCYIPLNMTILLCLAEDGIGNLPKSQTDMYKKFIEMTIVRYIQKVDTQVSKVITSIAELPHPHNKVFGELTRLAYKALKIDKIVFKLNEIKEVCPNLAMISSNWNGLGLLKAIQHFNAEIGNVTFHFLHFSIQEYMAALYISMLSHNKQIKLLNKTFWQHRYYNTWIMYVGITCGSSFALKHFLSGNWFQFSTKIFKSSSKTSICRKFLDNKIKCLHLFQCLVESSNEDMIASVSKFFEGNQIDLSNQTLLPSDVNTLGFFLIRSINKHWEMLNLSGCNISSIGINVLCDRFLSKESRDIVVIKEVNFSYNQLNFSSAIQIFDLFKSWHASQLIIKDDEILKNHATIDMYNAIEDAFFTCNYYDNQICLQLGSFLFGYKIHVFPEFLNVVSKAKALYMLNCLQSTSERSMFEFLAKQRLREVHLINTTVPNQTMERLCSDLLLTTETNLFIYNTELSDQDADKICMYPELSDQDADEIYGLKLSSESTDRIMMIISNSKIQGTLNTGSLSKQLTKLEILNIAVNVNKKCAKHIENYPWQENLCWDGNNSDLIDHTFVRLLHKITCNKWNWQLKIALIEKDILIAHKVDYECVSEKIKMHQSLKAVYLSDCNIESTEYQVLFDTNITLTDLCIFKSFIDHYWLSNLGSNLYSLNSCKEMFIHSLCDVNIKGIWSRFGKHCSTVLVTKDEMLGCNPTTKQIALALQLEPSINVLNLAHCQRNFDRFNQIIALLTTPQNNWSKVDFMNCQLGEFEYEALQNHLNINKKFSTIKVLKVSSNQLTKSLVPKFIETILIWKVQQLIFYDISHTVYGCFITKFTTTITSNTEKLFLSVTYSNIRSIYFCNYSWEQITRLLKNIAGATLYIFNCHFPLQGENINITQLIHISKLHIIDSTLNENTIVDIIETFVERNLEITICNTSMHIDDEALYNFIISNKLLYQSTVKFVLAMENFICSYNTTEDQLLLLQSQKLNDLEHTIVTLFSDDKNRHEQELFVFQNKHLTALHSNGKTLQTDFVAKLVSVLKRISSLKYFGIDRYMIASEVANDIVITLSHNKELQYLYLNSKLEDTDLLNIMEVLLRNLTNLNAFEIGYNNITDQVTEYLTSVISHNAQLQHFSITNSYLLTTDAIKLSKSLQKASNLQQLTINSSNIYSEAGNFIAAVVSHNSQLKTLDLDNNSLQSKGIKIIATSLQDISTLTKLQIRNNGITIEASDDIAAALSCNTQLQELDISKNYLQSTGAITIAKALQSKHILKKLFISSNNITEEAADDIAAVICSNTQLQDFDISENNLQSTGAIKIARALQSISTLKKLCISDNHITGKAADDIATAVSCNSELQELDISNNCFQAGIIKIAKALHHVVYVMKLYVSDNNITDEAADDIAIAISCNTQLQQFDIGRNSLQSTGAIKIIKALQNVTALTKLYINNNNITDAAADDIATALSCNTELQELDISNNWFQAAGILKIAKALQHTSTLKKLNISSNYIGDKAANDIAAALSFNVQLQELDIGKTALQSKGLMIIAKALQSISRLCISDNNVTDEAAEDIAAVVYRLQELNIGFNKLGSIGTIQIMTALCNNGNLAVLQIENNKISDEAAESIAAAITCNPNLQKLNFSTNRFTIKGVLTIIKALQSVSKLIKLCMSNCNITDEAVDEIKIALTCNSQLQELDISDNNLQAKGTTKITKVLQQISTLTKLNISKNNITEEEASDIEYLLYGHPQLQELNLGFNRFPLNSCVRIAVALSKMTNLRVLQIENIEITSRSARSIAEAICSNTKLETLNCSSNLSPGCVVEIMKALQSISTLTKLYIGNCNVTEDAADDIAAAISCNTQLQELDISKNNLQSTGAIKIAVALQNISMLTKLYISDNNITSKAANDIAAAIYGNAQLQEFDVSNNDLQSTGAIKIAKAIQSISTLTKLYISNNNVADKAADDVATAVHCNNRLQEFDVSKNQFEAAGFKTIAKALQSNVTLKKLYITDNNVTDEAANHIALLLQHNSQLQELDIGLTQNGVVCVSEALRNIVNLRVLKIKGNELITDKVAESIAVAVSFKTDLQMFAISKTFFSTKGIEKVAKALKSISTLTKLYISNNSLSDETAGYVAAIIYSNTQLQEFDISKNNLQSIGIIKIAKALQKISTLMKLYINNNHNITDEAADDIAIALSCNNQLQELDISNNQFQLTGMMTIARTLQGISTLKKLYISNKNISDKAAAALFSSTQLEVFDASGITRMAFNSGV